MSWCKKYGYLEQIYLYHHCENANTCLLDKKKFEKNFENYRLEVLMVIKDISFPRDIQNFIGPFLWVPTSIGQGGVSTQWFPLFSHGKKEDLYGDFGDIYYNYHWDKRINYTIYEAIEYLILNAPERYGYIELERRGNSKLRFGEDDDCTVMAVDYLKYEKSNTSTKDERIILHAHFSVGHSDRDTYTLVDISKDLPHFKYKWKECLNFIKLLIPLFNEITNIILNYIPPSIDLAYAKR